MNGVLFPLGIAWLLAVPAFGGSKYSRDVPSETVPTAAVTSITLDARNVSAGRAQAEGTAPNPEATRMTTTHSATVEIDVGNLGADVANVTVHWFWVGRYATSGNWFRSGEGGKTLAIDPKKSEIVFAENGDIESHDTRAAHEHYQSGGNMLGWIVIVTNDKGEVQAVKASTSYVQGFAASPPPRKRK